mgnify:CR=1 FL=1
MMRGWGWAFLIAGFAMAGAGTFMDISVAAPTDPLYGVGAGGSDRVANFELIAIALRLTIAGGFLATVGAVFILAARLTPPAPDTDAS